MSSKLYLIPESELSELLAAWETFLEALLIYSECETGVSLTIKKKEIVMFSFWKENHVLRGVVCGALLVAVLAAVFVWNPFQGHFTGFLLAASRWGTLIGGIVATVALFVNPLLEDYA